MVCSICWPGSWDADAVRDDLRDYVVDAFGDRERSSGRRDRRREEAHSVGVTQYSGTAGRIENSKSGSI